MTEENYKYPYVPSKYVKYVCGVEPCPENCNVIIKNYGYVLTAENYALKNNTVILTSQNAASAVKSVIIHRANAAAVVPLALKKSNITAPMGGLNMTVKICCGITLAIRSGNAVQK